MLLQLNAACMAGSLTVMWLLSVFCCVLGRYSGRVLWIGMSVCVNQTIERCSNACRQFRARTQEDRVSTLRARPRVNLPRCRNLHARPRQPPIKNAFNDICMSSCRSRIDRQCLVQQNDIQAHIHIPGESLLQPDSLTLHVSVTKARRSGEQVPSGFFKVESPC